ncbi:MAG TPA: c-type cytochrome [Chryseosolibacter sp.]
MKKLFALLILLVLLAGCGNEKPKDEGGDDGYDDNELAEAPKKVDDGKGLGEIKVVTLNTPLEQERIIRGKAIYEMKCSACHKLTDQRVVGPGWKDVTKRRKPEWIMNMITNVDVMLDQDAEAQKLLELCLTRMPNQNVSVGDSRDILEFMRQNDGEK